MKIAVASQNFRTVTPHAGKTRRWIVFELADGGDPVEVERLDLPREMTIHGWKGRDEPHPLFDMDAVLVGSCGAGFVRRLAANGVRVAVAAASEPQAALRAYLASGLADCPLDEATAAALGAAEAAHAH